MSNTLNSKIRNIRPKRDGLTTTDIAVISRMADYANEETMELFPHQETLASEMGVNRSTINRCIRKMKDKGMFTHIQCRKHVNRPNVFTFDPNCHFLNECERLTTAEKKAHQNRHKHVAELPQEGVKAPQETSEAPQDSVEVLSNQVDAEGFKAIYSAYPKKVRKLEAKKKWNALEDKPEVDVVIKAIEAFRRCANWQKDDGQYIPQLANFITNETWQSPPLLPKQPILGKPPEWDQETTLGEAEPVKPRQSLEILGEEEPY
jgi:transposase